MYYDNKLQNIMIENVELKNATISSGYINGSVIANNTLHASQINTMVGVTVEGELHALRNEQIMLQDELHKKQKQFDALVLLLTQKGIIKGEEEINEVLKSIELMEKLDEENKKVV